MKWAGIANQQRQDFLHRADLTLNGSAQLVLARSQARSYLLLKNNGTQTMYLEFGSGAAHCALTSGAVSSVTVDNAGFNYTKPPVVRFRGGGYAQNTAYLGLNQVGGESPTNVALAIAHISAGAISSIEITNPGSLYVIAPYVQLFNTDLDPYGCAVPTIGTGIPIAVGEKMEWNGSCCPTDPISVIGTNNDKLVCRWME